MASVVTLRPPGRRRSVGMAVGAAVALAVLVAGLAFANSVGAARVADNARALHWVNASLGTSSALRLALVQATTFVELERTGQATPDDVEFAMTQVTEARGELRDLEQAGGQAASLPYLTRFLGVGDTIAGDLEAKDTETAHDSIMGGLEQAYLDLVGALRTEQSEIQTLIDSNTEGAARSTDFVRFFLTFAIPAAAVVVYRFLARKAVREHQIKVDVELAAERAVSRAKDEFIAGLSHELRTPLTSIYGFAEVLTEEPPKAIADARELAQIIANEAAEMTRMVDDLLAAARIESSGIEIEKAPTRVADVVAAAVSPFARAGLEVAVAGEEVWVDTDGARLRHILVNLLSNAARHGGPQVGIEVSASEGFVEIEVWDSGPGVSEGRLERLFDRFVNEGSSPLLTGSLGLGLAVASRLAGLLGGTLSYQRFVNKTYFVVRLPAAEHPETSSAEANVADVIRAMSA